MAVVLVVSDSAALVVAVVLGETRSDDLRLLQVLTLGVDFCLVLQLTIQIIKCKDLVVITDRENCIILRDNFKTPCLSFMMSCK